jgi:diguanylate cyclase (GGDEF)-like protein
MGWKELPRALKFYIILLLFAGVAAFLRQALFQPPPLLNWSLLVYIALAFLTASISVRIPYTDVHFSMDTAFVFAILMIYGPLEAMAADGISKVINTWLEIPDKRKSWYKIPFNVASGVLSVFAAGLAYRALLPSQPTYFEYVLPLVCMTTAYFLVNSWIVAAAISISMKANVVKLWIENFLWTGLGFFAALSIAIMLYLLNFSIGGLSFVVSVPILALMLFSQKVYLRREEDSKKHIEQLESMHMSTIETLSLAIDAKDQITHGHVHRVTAFVTRLAEFLGIADREELKGLRFAALVHDIGKIGVPDLILTKPGRFTADEMERMRMHPIIGAQILHAVAYDFPIAEVVLRHHERWDGEGYPDRLKGEAINKYARMLAICDVFDALRSDRPYRRGMSREKSINIIREERGKAFDPAIVDVFLERLEDLEAAVAEEDRRLAELTFSTPSSTDMRGLQPGQNSLELYGQITYTQQEVFLLYEVAQMVGRSLPAEKLAEEFVAATAKLIPYNTAIVYLAHQKDREMRPLYVESRDAPAFAGIRVPFGRGVTGWAAENGVPLRNVDPDLDLAGVEINDQRCLSALAAPLRFDGKTLGVVSLYSEKKDFYQERHQDLLVKLVGLVTPGMVNALQSEELKEADDVDQLTGLAGVRALKRYLAGELRDRSAAAPYTLFLLDLKNLYEVNVRYGHEAGDRLLHALSRAVAGALRPEDRCFRAGGSELAVVAQGAGREGAAVVAARLRRAVAQLAVKVGGGMLSPAIALGGASFPEDSGAVDELWRMVDSRVYKDKMRNGVPAPEAVAKLETAIA